MKLKLFSRGARGFCYAVVKYSKMAFTESPAKAASCCEETADGPPPSFAMYEALKDSCQNNATFFQPDDSENGQRLYQGFMTLIDHIDTVWPLVDHVRKVAPQYDFDASSPGNGYRSFVSVVDSCVLHGLKLSRQVCTGRDALLFRKGYFVREVESCGQLLASLGTCLHHIHTLLTWAPPGDLFPSEARSPEELFSQADTINQYCFYGRCLGFQFLPSMRGILKGISICMAGFSEAYYSHGNLISSVWTGGQYLIDPEMRARRIVNISQSASVEFCKAFWFLAESEIMKRVPSLMSSTVAVNKVISIAPEPLTVSATDGTVVTVLPPTVHLGLQSLNVRLISVNKRNGMTGEGTSSFPAAEGVLFHCHGGGFVAQSSKSHEMYLREWAAKLNVPILSVDYSLAPQAPFPRALEEVYYAYCWMLNNFSTIGTTGKRIIFAGDSAGANLLASCTLKILSSGLRSPEGLFLAYAPLLVSFTPSPARLLCLMDPLLPFGFMMRCLKAYACPTSSSNAGCGHKNCSCKPACAAATSNVTSPLDSNGFLKVSPSQEGISEGPSSFEEVSPSDLAELQAHKSGSERRQSSDTTISAASLHSDHTATAQTSAKEVSLLEMVAFEVEKLDSDCQKTSDPTSASSASGATSLQSKHNTTAAQASLKEVSLLEMVAFEVLKSESKCLPSSDSNSAASLPSEHSVTGFSPPEDKSQQVVSDFLERYVLDSDTDSEGRRIPVIKPNIGQDENSHKEAESENSSTLVGDLPLEDQDRESKKRIKTRISEAATGIMGAMSSRLAYITGSNNINRSTQEELAVRSNLDALIARSPSDEFIFSVPRDPLLSPYWADDTLLKRFPPCRILTVHLDPCLDDCVMFAKKLKRLGNVVGIDVLEGLPHGFLNFALMAKEANEGSKLCVERIKQLMDLESGPPDRR